MSPRVLFEQDLETLKNKVSEMGEHAEISYDRMVYGIRENKEDILKTLLNTDPVSYTHLTLPTKA